MYNPRNFSAFKLKNIKNRTKAGVIPPYTIISWLLYSCVGIWFHELSASWAFLL
nr:MAG TPA: hypothetical protein [Bacteriophage sp.]